MTAILCHFRQTIFEINSTSKTQAFSVMKQKRQFHGEVITKKQTVVKTSTATDTSAEQRQTLDTVSNDDELKVQTADIGILGLHAF
jgi:hypothetical protein